ncbi:MAG: GNAT family protein [Chthoniobacter sp.]|nr:GNAT family protein [Chthoniobacter sp.]
MAFDVVPKSAFLVGERLYLRALADGDADGPYPGWLNDPEVCSGNSHHTFPYTREGALAYIERARQTRDELILAIVLREGDRHIGNIALQHIHPVNRSAELSVIIGERDVWGRGFAHEAAVLLVAHGFGVLNLERIACGTFAGNIAMQKLALRLGMKEEGRRRQAAFKNGRFEDIIEFGLLRHEFNNQ